MDVDFIVQLSIDDLDELLDPLARLGLKINRARIKRQLSGGYNIVSLDDKHSENRVDLIIQTEGKLERRPGRALGLRSFYQPPELLILSKLRMIKATVPRERSQKDKDDIVAVLRFTRVDRRRIIDQARREGNLEIFREILALSKNPAGRVLSPKNTVERLKRGCKQYKKRQYKVASSREDIDGILSS
jgi:hypothetical protein